MELRSLLHILITRWWIILPTVVITFGTAAVLAISQRPAYEAGTTLVVTPTADVADESLSALAVITRQTEITDTYAQIASSRLIARGASERLQLTGDERRDVRVVSRLIPGTTLLAITGRASDPQLAADYANAVSEALVDFVDDRYDVFDLSIVDVASVPDDPVAPNVPLILAAGLVAGIALGTGLAIASAIVFRPSTASQLRNVLDPETASFNEQYLTYRLVQEMSRTRRLRDGALALAVIDVNHRQSLDGLAPREASEAMRRIASLIDGHVRPEDVVARIDKWTFGVLMPDTTEEQALAMLQALRGRITAPALGTVNGAAVHAEPTAGVAEYRDGPTTDVQFVQQAMVALSASKAGPLGRTEVFSAVSKPSG